MDIEERKNQMRKELKRIEKMKAQKAEFKEKLHSSPVLNTQSAKYLGGHPDLSNEIDGIIKVNKIGVFFEVLLTVYKIHIPIESIIKAEFKNEEQISKDVTFTRLLALGVFAFAFKKKTKNQRNFLSLTYLSEGIENTIIFQSKNAGSLAGSITKIRQEFLKENPQAAISTQNEGNEEENDIYYEIRQLAELKEDGILSEEEFRNKKTELLSRI